MTGPTLGQLVEGPQERDAIHIAVVPMVAGEGLIPGERVAIGNDGRACRASIAVGVVDPFLTVAVKLGERFWLFMLPNTITSLRHEWAHPAFPSAAATAPDERAASERWLREFADENRISYAVLVEGAVSGEGATFGNDTPYEVRGADFWGHVEVVTGKRFGDGHRENTFWSCSC